jgi:spore maturation protein SpmA
MLNYIWLGLVLAAVVIGGMNGTMKELTESAFDRAKYAVMDLALPLAGIMALWLGVMRLAERSGLIQVMARVLRPVTTRLFPEVPPTHPAVGSMLMNMSANMLGLGNAATPLGLRAMEQLESLNKTPGTASNAMCTFLALNTSCIQFIPATAVAILAVNGSADPTAIIGTAFLATLCAASAAVTAAKVFEKWKFFRVTAGDAEPRAKLPDVQAIMEDKPPVVRALGTQGRVILAVFAALFALLLIDTAFPSLLLGGSGCGAGAADSTCPITGCIKLIAIPLVQAVSLLAIPFFLSFFPLYAVLRGVKVYEEFVEGAKEGFQVAIRIIPYLVAILVAIGMFRAAGGIDLLSKWLSPALDAIGFPTELLPLAVMRPLSGSGSLGLFSDIVKEHGADSLLARMAATMYGSTETTFYVLAVYFGAVAIRRTRHAVAAGLCGDVVGMGMSIVVCRIFFS